MKRTVLWLWLGLLTAAGCSGPATRRAEGPWPAPGDCWLLLKLELQVWHQVGGVSVPDVRGSARAEAAARSWLERWLKPRELHPAALDRDLAQHLALYDRTASVALKRPPSLPLDLGIGPGLSARATDCRWGLAVQGAAIPEVEGDPPLLSLGLIDLRSGALLWLAAQPVHGGAFTQPGSMERLLQQLVPDRSP